MPKDKTGLTPKQARFVAEYLIDLNATQAAIRAGYSKQTAYSQGQRLLKNAGVATAIAVGQKRVAAKLDITTERVLKELAQIGFAQPGEYFEWGSKGVTLIDKEKLTPEQMAAVAEVAQTVSPGGGSIRLKLHDKVAALTKIGQHLGMFVEKHEHKVTLTHEDALDELDPK